LRQKEKAKKTEHSPRITFKEEKRKKSRSRKVEQQTSYILQRIRALLTRKVIRDVAKKDGERETSEGRERRRRTKGKTFAVQGGEGQGNSITL